MITAKIWTRSWPNIAAADRTVSAILTLVSRICHEVLRTRVGESA